MSPIDRSISLVFWIIRCLRYRGLPPKGPVRPVGSRALVARRSRVGRVLVRHLVERPRTARWLPRSGWPDYAWPPRAARVLQLRLVRVQVAAAVALAEEVYRR